MKSPNFLTADWDAPAFIHTAMSLRTGGVSLTPYHSLNPATHVDDQYEAVLKNRQIIMQTLALPSEPIWLEQTHSINIVQADKIAVLSQADASFTSHSNVVCTVLTADCLPLLFYSPQGEKIAAVHAGWRGLLAGIIGQTITAMKTAEVSVWLGAAIGRCCFEVGLEVRVLFVNRDPHFSAAFEQISSEKWLVDIYRLARIDLTRQGVHNIYGGGLCTVCDSQRFYSYRREGITGRMATLIWKD